MATCRKNFRNRLDEHCFFWLCCTS
jgi:hypothetical protein